MNVRQIDISVYNKSVISFFKKVIPEDISKKEEAERILPVLIRKAIGNIEIVSRSFVEAMQKNESCFQKIDRFSFFKENRECGALVIGGITLIYTSNKVASNLYIVDAKEVVANVEYEFSKYIPVVNFNYIGTYLPIFISFFTSFLIFKKYAKVEIEIYNCGKKKKSNILKDNVKNMLPFNVKMLDCTWFTTICRDEGFKVRGHFRLQPKKINGEWVKELIYINEFEKHGYHRVAKKEKHETNN